MNQLIIGICLFILTVGSVVSQSVPSSVEKKIRQIYANKYPDDYSMQEALIKSQCESYLELNR